MRSNGRRHAPKEVSPLRILLFDEPGGRVDLDGFTTTGRADDTVEVNPLVPAGEWDWFCLDGVSYHGRSLTILWDETGKKYGKGKGLRVFADGVEIATAPKLTRVTGQLPSKPRR